MQTKTAKVLANEVVASGVYKLVARVPEPFEIPQVGQFLTIRIGEGIAPLLRRPFAYSNFDSSNGTLELIYEKRGNATSLLSSYQANDSIDILGPLGKGFTMPANGTLPVLLAGGVGIGPMLFLYQELVNHGFKPILIVGARSAERLPRELFPKATILYTDDGSIGGKGTVLDGLISLKSRSLLNHPLLYLCGPHVMMRVVYLWSKSNLSKASVQVSLEQTMGCAVGACMGCVVKIHHQKGFARVCCEGPVFDGDLINWE